MFNIVDILLPTGRNVVLNENVGGSLMLYSPVKHLIMLGNSRKGVVSFYDIRNNIVLKNIEVSKDEVKTMALNTSNNVLICGTSNLQVKYYYLDTFEEITETTMRSTLDKKMGHITHLDVMDESIFASSSEGLLSFVNTMNY
mmetsp:Transcript_11583/g.10088  ORF Transcript_11583/g.10088 Transcript_11583/m.10088 type:complete len:142 (-) Transcript_11583:68-493(-)